MIKDLWDIGKDVWALIHTLDATRRRQIWSYLYRRWKALLILGFIVFSVVWLIAYLDRRPERVISAYYAALNRDQYEVAWSLLSDRYRDKLGTFEEFRSNYKSVISYTNVEMHSIGVRSGVAAIYNRVEVIEQDTNNTTLPKQYCFLTRLQKEPVSDGWRTVYSVPFGHLFLTKDWKIVINNYRGVCHYFNL